MRSPTFLVLVAALGTPLLVLAGTGYVTGSTCTTAPVTSITINQDGSASPACVEEGSTITFQAYNSGRFIVIFGNGNPFNNGHAVIFTDDGTAAGMIGGGFKANEYSYIACWAAAGTHAFACKDPKIIIDSNRPHPPKRRKGKSE